MTAGDATAVREKIAVLKFDEVLDQIRLPICGAMLSSLIMFAGRSKHKSARIGK